MRYWVFFVFLIILRVSNAAENRQDYIGSGFLSNLERIIANDELKCVPRLLCERAAGGEPGQLRALHIDTSSLFTLLTYMGLDESSSPMLEIGRAIMTGLSNRGDSYGCYKQYPSCPRDQTRLLYYLNNHRGGFFRGFGKPFYGRQDEGQSRIVNKAQSSNAIESEADFYRPGDVFFSKESNFQNGFSSNSQGHFPNSADFILPVRKGRKFSFETGLNFQKLPSFNFEASLNLNRPQTQFSFPIRDSDVVNYYKGQQGFFPAT